MFAAVNLYLAAFTLLFPVGFGNIISSYLCYKLKNVVYVVLRDLIK